MKSAKTTIDDLLNFLGHIREGIPVKKDITEDEIRLKLAERRSGIYKVIDSTSVLGLWCLV